MKFKPDFEKIYEKLPVFVQNAACSYYGRKELKLRFNEFFDKKLEDLMESEKWGSAEIDAYQSEKLNETVRNAYENVPYYRELMNELKLTPEDINTPDDLKKLPVLTKEDVKNNMDKLISEKVRKDELVFRHTSGTTGKSLQFYVGNNMAPYQWAIWWRHRKRFGVDPFSLHANFTGKPATPTRQRRPPFWRWNRPMHQAVINMHHIVPGKIGDIVSFLDSHPFKYYSGYPSIIHALAAAASEMGLNLKNPPDFIFPGAENVLDYQRKDIEKFTGAIITDQYGFSEACGNASQCPEMVYHEDFEFGVMECVDPVSVDGGRIKGKIVCTGFAGPEFPFIRYEVGDIGVWENPDRKCACGRESKVLVNIEGRVDDYVVTPEGGRIMRFDYIFKDTLNVKESQIIQDKPGEVRVLIVRRPAYDGKDEKFIRDEIAKWISPGLKVRFDYVNEIQRESNGKFRAVKSLLKGRRR